MTDAHTVLIAPLDWGLGHAARCVPIIRQELNRGHRVILAASGSRKVFLQSFFPELEILETIPNYAIRYSRWLPFSWMMFFQLPKIYRAIRKENHWLNELLVQRRIDHVISDNRYGLFSKTIVCSIITHQLFPIVPKSWEKLVRSKMADSLNHFNEIWVPDFESEKNLSGSLSHGVKVNKVKFIGPLSRFEKVESKQRLFDHNGEFLLAIVSGPEPQRSIFQHKLVELFKLSNRKAVLICGLPEQSFDIQDGQVRILSHADDDLFSELVEKAFIIFSRSGYSTLMDLNALGRTGIFVPTPGQTEQEYLAQWHTQNFGAEMVLQKNLIQVLSSDPRIGF